MGEMEGRQAGWEPVCEGEDPGEGLVAETLCKTGETIFP